MEKTKLLTAIETTVKSHRQIARDVSLSNLEYLELISWQGLRAFAMNELVMDSIDGVPCHSGYIPVPAMILNRKKTALRRVCFF